MGREVGGSGATVRSLTQGIFVKKIIYFPPSNLKDMPVKAIVTGGTGLIGKELVIQLASSNDIEHVVVLGRRYVDYSHPKIEQHIVDLSDGEALRGYMKGDVLFCALGTTIKKAGSQENFRLVDHHYVVNPAKVAAEEGVKQFCVVSSIGAKAESKNFYLRTKGEMENDVQALPFSSVHIFRPSLLLGNRAENRPGERIAETFFKVFGFVFFGKLKRYAPINASKVAAAMMKAAMEGKPGTNIYESDMII